MNPDGSMARMPELVAQLAERQGRRAAVERQRVADGNDGIVALTTSVGIAVWAPADSTESLIGRAENRAMTAWAWWGSAYLLIAVGFSLVTLRAVVGDMDLDHTLSQRDQINAKLRIGLDEATDKWGVKVTRVDVKNINPPEDVRITMEKQMTAERNRRALVLQAEGDRQANQGHRRRSCEIC